MQSKDRKRRYAEGGGRKHTPRLPFLPHQGLYVITCIHPRTDPALFLQLGFGEAIVARTVGGRVTDAVLRDLAYIGYLVEEKAPEGPYFEATIIHHTDCGSALLADDEFRHGFAGRSGYDEQALAELPVLDPAPVRADVERVLASPQVSSRITVSGHVYDVATGLSLRGNGARRRAERPCRRPAPRRGTRARRRRSTTSEKTIDVVAPRHVDVDPADQRDQARHRVQPLPVRPAQIGLAPTQHGERDDLRDRLHEHRAPRQHGDHRGQVEEASRSR